MTSAKGFYQNLSDDLRRAVKSVMPFRATADGDAAGKVSIIRLGQALADGESYGRLDGFDIADGDDVVCFTIGGKPVVAKLLSAVPTGHILTGNLTVKGAINSPLVFVGSQSTSDAASTTSTVNYSTAMTLSCALGEGTWTVRSVASVQLIHSAGGNVNWQTNIDGVAGTERTLQANASAYATFLTTNEVTGRTGTINVTVRFKSSAAGTTSARNPMLLVIATRTA